MSDVHQKKVVLITGCSSGFGLRIAARLAADNYSVYATMRNLDKQQPLFDEVRGRNGTVAVLPLDVTDCASIDAAVKSIIQKHTRIDVLINNAGYAIGGCFEDLSQEEIRSQMEVNFFGVQNVTRAVLPIMREHASGKIINISSISGLYALPGFGAYNASKWALEGFSESLMYELKPFNIQVHLVEPGVYKTKIFYENRRYAGGFSNTASPYYSVSQYLKTTLDTHIAKGIRDPEEVAACVQNLIETRRAPFRCIPDSKSRLLYGLRRMLPFRLFSLWLYRAMFSEMKQHS